MARSLRSLSGNLAAAPMSRSAILAPQLKKSGCHHPSSQRQPGRACTPPLNHAPILIEAMERHGHLQLTPEVRAGLEAMSAATIDRALREAREPGGGRKRRHAPPSAAIRRNVPVRTFDGWDDPAPGFVEADLVAHSGPTAKGSFVQTLTQTDI